MKDIARNTILIICGLFLVGSPFAIDKSKKDEPSPQKSTDSTKASSASKKTYNDFIDANGNGIDDRAEKKAATSKTDKDSTATNVQKTNP